MSETPLADEQPQLHPAFSAVLDAAVAWWRTQGYRVSAEVLYEQQNPAERALMLAVSQLVVAMDAEGLVVE